MPLHGLPLFERGDDLAGAILAALERQEIALAEGDILVVAQKIVSKAEGRTVDLASVSPGKRARELAETVRKPAALVQLILDEALEVMRAVPNVLITRHRTGHVTANSGIDASNVAGGDTGTVLLWPEDPDHSARGIREAIAARSGVAVGVIVADSLGRAWRLGTIGTAIGSSGMPALDDRCGSLDLYGRPLQATWVAAIDSVAAAAVLAMGEGAEGTPAALVRGVRFTRQADDGADDLLRPPQEDLFR
ncbi:coenzyme F420-0:L-glutamate ligase [Sphingomonas sp. G-3-2-10]|uniref:coenzyme F420-0:L-glutamate ligase n=1 Tax=Sphingomonas sp. G-3-2-10 TaxID=2728838 RepID=UPI00146DFD3B|nr:coenzyme F420-0:L-glutamate ligase [Sphingomonas sp. G-3-2-10]NML08446.1 coenzyme F420-0:L-glutamate ligase [Sphingomonas sp. G-3-2-10]